MFVIRAPSLFLKTREFRAEGYAVQGLNEKDAAKCLVDTITFATRLQELQELKTEAQKEEDEDKDVLAPTVKKRKLNSNGDEVLQGEDFQNVTLKRKKPAGCAKRNAKHVLPK